MELQRSDRHIGCMDSGADISDACSHPPRRHPRPRTLKSALIVFNSGHSSLNVTVRDLSESGVKLKLSAAGWAAPGEFNLIMFNPNTGTPKTYSCQKRWQRGDLVGASFMEGGPTARSLPSLRRNP